MKKKIKRGWVNSLEDKRFPLPIYKPEDDIYLRDQKESYEEEDDSGNNAPGYIYDDRGEDLDVPGADLDNSNEAIGEEDEENNYYSLKDEEDDRE